MVVAGNNPSWLHAPRNFWHLGLVLVIHDSHSNLPREINAFWTGKSRPLPTFLYFANWFMSISIVIGELLRRVLRLLTTVCPVVSRCIPLQDIYRWLFSLTWLSPKGWVINCYPLNLFTNSQCRCSRVSFVNLALDCVSLIPPAGEQLSYSCGCFKRMFNLEFSLQWGHMHLPDGEEYQSSSSHFSLLQSQLMLYGDVQAFNV